MTLLFTATAPEQAPAPPRPYQGVRVKEPVKELLRRKRGHASNGAAVTPTAVRGPPWPVCVYACVCVGGGVSHGVGWECISLLYGMLSEAGRRHSAMVWLRENGPKVERVSDPRSRKRGMLACSPEGADDSHTPA